MTKADFSQILALINELALAAGAVIHEMRENQSFELSFKSETNLLTTADLKAEEIIIAGIKEHFPDDQILAEETQATLTAINPDQGLWIIDPIDGTTNYAYGLRDVGVSIAYALHGSVQVGLVHNPFTQETFHAVKGNGAFLNGTKINCGNCQELSRALVVTGFPYNREIRKRAIPVAGIVTEKCRDLRRLGAASLDICYVACGRLDAMYESLSPWDIAAAVLIAKEAGAVVQYSLRQTDQQALIPDLASHGLVIGNQKIASDLKDLIISAATQGRV
ncbi:inositol monophosphatase [bacterium]|nr:inositol monophosphatase [bacterium]